jgi:glycosyltransferase involved in cell wall biosynthesis
VKLLILAKQYLPEISAQSIRVFQMAKRFSELDPDLIVKIIAFDPEGGKISENAGSDDRIEVERYSRNVLPSFAFKPQSLNPLLLIYWIYLARMGEKNFGPDIILATTPPFAPVVGLYIASIISRKKFLFAVDYRDDLSSVIDRMAEGKNFYIKYPLKAANRLMSILLFRSISKAALVSTVNTSLQEDLHKKNKNVILVPNGLDLEELKEISQNFNREDVLKKNGIKDTKSKIIAYLGDLDMPYYIPEAILEPMKRLRAKGYNLTYIIIGDGKRRNLIEKIAKEMGLKGSVYLLGRKNHRDSMELLEASDVAFHTLKEGDPQAKHAIATKVFEYLGCKLPILTVADDGSAISELVAEKEVGLSVKWDELDRIEYALKNILDHPEIYKKNLEINHEYFLHRFDRNKGIDVLYENLKELKNKGNLRPTIKNEAND